MQVNLGPWETIIEAHLGVMIKIAAKSPELAGRLALAKAFKQKLTTPTHY